MRNSLIAIIIVLLGSGAAVFGYQQTAPATATPNDENVIVASAAPTAPGTPVAKGCQDFSNVYHPQRLQVLNPCVTVTGTVQSVKREPDGDDHIRIALDPGQDKYLNAKNQGLLVVEPICMHTVTQRDAVSACASYHNTQKEPRVGQHITATGPWVLDLAHGWQEIHPASIT